MHSPESVRIDKWLWAVRLYKTRSLAAAACHAGKVQVAGENVKAARNVRVGEIVTAGCAEITKTVKVLALLDARVGAKLVPNFLEDQTPASEYEKQRERRAAPIGIRPPGAGRPTKKDRRSIIKFIK
jgi:ribosome-associated heat shock protein Hsp15